MGAAEAESEKHLLYEVMGFEWVVSGWEVRTGQQRRNRGQAALVSTESEVKTEWIPPLFHHLYEATWRACARLEGQGGVHRVDDVTRDECLE